MGQISLVVSIVLLVSGTFATLKSPVKQDNPKEYPEFHSDGKVRIHYEATYVKPPCKFRLSL